MFEIKSFENWIIDDDAPYGSGASEKLWIYNPETFKKGIFKYPKTTSFKTLTGEYWAEKLASEIGKLIGISVADVDLGIYESRRGSMSYMILDKGEVLIEGLHFIAQKYPNYDSDRFLDKETGKRYSIQMIMEALDEFDFLQEEFFAIPIFDCLIGNSDRHHNNWGVIVDFDKEVAGICPLYDNGSSLCCYVNNHDATNVLKDQNRFEALVYRKSKSLIGWEEQKKPRHFDLLRNLRNEYYDETIEYVHNIIVKLTDKSVEDLINKFSDDVITVDMKKLLIKYLIERRNAIEYVYFQEGGRYE